MIEETIYKKLAIIRFIFGDSLFTPLQKEVLQEMMEFLSNYYPQQNYHICFTNMRELTKEEKSNIINTLIPYGKNQYPGKS